MFEGEGRSFYIHWDSTYSSYLEPLYRLLKKATHTITFLHLCSQCKSLLCKLQVLPVHSIYKFQVSSFVFDHFNNLLLPPLSLQFNCDYRDSQTRSRFNLHKSFLRYQFAICYQAPNYIWIEIPINVRNKFYQVKDFTIGRTGNSQKIPSSRWESTLRPSVI